MANHLFVTMAAAVLALGLAGCQPTDKPANLIDRKPMEKAKAVESVMQQRADEPRKAEEEQK